jgi:hypothetical protein
MCGKTASNIWGNIIGLEIQNRRGGVVLIEVFHFKI